VSGPLDVAIGQALIVTAVVIAIRFLWIFPVAAADEKLRRRQGAAGEPTGWREMTIASWAGMRGVVTLACVLALPVGTPGFPERDRLIFIAFVVIMVTMLVQGLTLPLLVGRLGVSVSNDERDQATQNLIRRARAAGQQRLDELRSGDDVDADVLEHASDNADRMWNAIGFAPEDDDPQQSARHTEQVTNSNAIKNQILEAARNEVLSARSESGTDPTVVDAVLRRLDARGPQPE
jgi:monovalent cation/hydrogen antiporter